MKWSKERDVLIAQTKAFVQSVTGRRPEIPAAPVAIKPTLIEKPGFTVNLARAEPTVRTEPVSIEPISISAVAKTERIDVPPSAGPPPVRTYPQSEVRKEIQNRVAAFQAHQHRFHREREAYFKSVLTKVRSDIENGPETPSA